MLFVFVFQTLVNRILRLFTKHSVFLFLCLALTINWFVHCMEKSNYGTMSLPYNELHGESYSIVADLLP